jgi:hypothetical protein
LPSLASLIFSYVEAPEPYAPAPGWSIEPEKRRAGLGFSVGGGNRCQPGLNDLGDTLGAPKAPVYRTFVLGTRGTFAHRLVAGPGPRRALALTIFVLPLGSRVVAP